MRRGVALCHHLWRNAVACEETLVMADAQEDQGFDRDPDVTVFVEEDDEDGDGDGFGRENGRGSGGGDGDGDVVMDGEGIGRGFSDGFGAGDGFGHEDGEEYGNVAEWDMNIPYPFPNEAQQIP